MSTATHPSSAPAAKRPFFYSSSELIREVKSNYSTLVVYKGGALARVETKLGSDDTPSVETIDSRISFTRDQELSQSFEISEDTCTYVLGMKSSKSGTIVEHRDGVHESVDTVDLAIASLTGSTSGLAHEIPRLLIPKAVTGWSILELENPTIECGLENGANISILRGVNIRGSHYTVTVDMRSLLIRRLEVVIDNCGLRIYRKVEYSISEAR